MQILSGPGSSVGIATGYGLNAPRIEFQWRRDFPLPFTPDLGHTQRTVQRVPALSPGVQRLGCGVAPPPTRAEIKERVEIYVYALFGPSWSILGWTLYLHIMFVSQTCNENVKIKIYIKNTVSRFVLHGCQIWFQNKALKRISGYKRQEVTGGLLPILFTNKPSSV